MVKKVTHIEVPKEWESTNDWDSHRPLLWLALTHTIKPVCEFGCGEGSTELLEKYCHENKVFFSSYETNHIYAEKYNSTKINNYDDVVLIDGKHSQGLLFIDLAPGEQRKEMIKKHSNSSDVIIVHDSEPGSQYVYGMANILSTFKYRLDYQPEGKPHTTAVSNFIDVTQWV